MVATPIGNLEDITFRALKVLKQVDFIAAEDTRVTRKLLAHFGIHARLISFHEHSPPQRIEQLLNCLRGGSSVALVTNAGTPCVSDPGASLVRAASEAGIKVMPVPGPSAVTAALSASGFAAQRFVFVGFLPRKAGERQEVLERIKGLPFPLVLYEAPHRLVESLQTLLSVLGDRDVTIARELTKVHEQLWRTSLAQALLHYQAHHPIGEFTLIIDGAKEVGKPKVDWQQVDKALTELLAQGLSVREAAAEIAQKFGVSRRQAYLRALELDRIK